MTIRERREFYEKQLEETFSEYEHVDKAHTKQRGDLLRIINNLESNLKCLPTKVVIQQNLVGVSDWEFDKVKINTSIREKVTEKMSCDGLGTIEGEIEFSIIEDETHELLKYPHEIPNEGQFISVLKRTRTIIREDNNGGRTAEHIVLTYYNIKILEFNFKYKGTESGKDYYDCYIDFA